MHGEDHMLTVLEVLRHILDLIGIDIRRIHLHRGRQVDDDLAALTALPCVEHGVTDLGRVIHLGAREGLRRIFEADVTREAGGILLYELGTGQGDVNDFFLTLMEHHVSLKDGSGVIDVDDGLLETGEAVEGTLELLGTALHQHLYGHIIRDHLPLDQLTQEVILDLRCGREAHLDFLEAQLYKHLEKFDLLLYAHRIHQRLVTIT